MNADRNKTFSHLRKESLDIYNRLKSIEEDIKFVNQVHDAYPDFPLLPNLRCGAWYTDPRLAAPHPVYFKSTDGHFANWSFNLRRANLHLLNLSHRGIVLVDSTRSGKRMPDALSKTVPIWCTVVNRAVCLRHRETPRQNWDISLHTPPGVVSTQEHSQIVPLLDGWAESLNKSSYRVPDLTLPLRPIWITPASSSFPKFSPTEQTFIPIICVSASRQVEEGFDRRSGGFVYIQGSGDDHELWGMGLNPGIFWHNRERILSANRSEVETIITSCVNGPQNTDTVRLPSAVARVNGRILLCATSDLIVSSPGHLSTTCSGESGDVAYLVLSSRDRNDMSTDDAQNVLYIPTPDGKKGHPHFLQMALPRAMEFVQTQLTEGMRVCIACDSGKDLSIGVATAALQKYFDDEGNFVVNGLHDIIPGRYNTLIIYILCLPTNYTLLDKRTIRMRLEWIIAARPEANPARDTLKRVNEFLLTSNSFLRRRC
ncbi:initiator tRNA phosphoribosyl transferase [Lentinula aff. lateritia]|uniref:Initiator tRNA phosphoribosyl transferase n=1 Tax=Lentinula aff. lateritia TaxID=2804960 RepID=A0ACC1U1M5_9AGAR|nr:initiator tRNA phosphoribosyl transferase [Lentinula aff. lateritia]